LRFEQISALCDPVVRATSLRTAQLGTPEGIPFYHHKTGKQFGSEIKSRELRKRSNLHLTDGQTISFPIFSLNKGWDRCWGGAGLILIPSWPPQDKAIHTSFFTGRLTVCRRVSQPFQLFSINLKFSLLPLLPALFKLLLIPKLLVLLLDKFHLPLLTFPPKYSSNLRSAPLAVYFGSGATTPPKI
jgi:hypothetical protein